MGRARSAVFIAEVRRGLGWRSHETYRLMPMSDARRAPDTIFARRRGYFARARFHGAGEELLMMIADSLFTG